MTDIEKRMADVILKYYQEEEYCEPYTDYRLYADEDLFNGTITTMDEMTDVLFFHYTENEETGDKYIQLFLSSPDDMAQDFVFLSALSEEEQKKIDDLFFKQAERFGTEIAQ